MLESIEMSPSRSGGDRVRPDLLLIDDDSMVGRFVCHAAEECGCDARRTSCVASFTRSFHTETPDIVVVDLCMPGCDGIELLRFMSEESFRGLVLVISGLDQRVRDAAMRFGEALGLNMAEPIAKPFRVEELERRLAPAMLVSA